LFYKIIFILKYSGKIYISTKILTVGFIYLQCIPIITPMVVKAVGFHLTLIEVRYRAGVGVAVFLSP